MKSSTPIYEVAVILAALVLSVPVFAQSSSSFSPLSNSISTPRPFDPGTNTTNPSALAVAGAESVPGQRSHEHTDARDS